jgi:hypothetical protein
MQDWDADYPPEGNRSLLPRELSGCEKRHLEQIRSLDLAERGEMILAACRTARLIEESRLASRLPPVQPAPWPESTWEWLRRYARDVQQS